MVLLHDPRSFRGRPFPSPVDACAPHDEIRPARSLNRFDDPANPDLTGPEPSTESSCPRSRSESTLHASASVHHANSRHHAGFAHRRHRDGNRYRHGLPGHRDLSSRLLCILQTAGHRGKYRGAQQIRTGTAFRAVCAAFFFAAVFPVNLRGRHGNRARKRVHLDRIQTTSAKRLVPCRLACAPDRNRLRQVRTKSPRRCVTNCRKRLAQARDRLPAMGLYLLSTPSAHARRQNTTAQSRRNRPHPLCVRNKFIKPKQMLVSGGPGRIRTCDQAVMSGRL